MTKPRQEAPIPSPPREAGSFVLAADNTWQPNPEDAAPAIIPPPHEEPS